MAKYTVTIKDNKNGDVVLNAEANAMIGALTSEKGASTIILEGTEEETVAVINVVQHAITRFFEAE